MKTQTPNSTAELASNALASLAAALESGKSEALTSYLSVMARFHNYSWNNCLLIALQRPNATHVAGFHAWLKLGRHVRKAEKGIAILAPILCKLHADRSEEKHEDESKLNSALSRLVGFRTAYVFDVSQTEGKDFPLFAVVRGDPTHYTEKLKAFIASRQIVLEYSAAIAPAKGVSCGGRITLLPGLSAAEEFAVLSHETAHEILHRSERRGQTTKAIRETEAEAVAFVICYAIALDTNTAAADYIKLYNGDHHSRELPPFHPVHCCGDTRRPRSRRELTAVNRNLNSKKETYGRDKYAWMA